MYPFATEFYKFPSYLRRTAITEAIGKVSSYKSNYANWEQHKVGHKPAFPKAGFVYPAMYRDNCFVRTGTYTARLKVFIRNTWDWVDVSLKKNDVDYILHHCSDRKECVPTLMKRGKEWFLDFVFEETVTLSSQNLQSTRVLGVDLGINHACVISVMTPDGTILGRAFLRMSREEDCLQHTVNRIKKAQQRGARKTPRLWAQAKGINQNIAAKTAAFIMETAKAYQANVIVFEHLELSGRKRGSKTQKLHLWKARSIQEMVTNKAHRIGIHISHVCAWGTSRLAYDGSGRVERDSKNYSLCTFSTGKRYHCDLNASYNIAARYFVRERMKSLPETVRLDIAAKVPECIKRSTCTLSTLYNLNAVLSA